MQLTATSETMSDSNVLPAKKIDQVNIYIKLLYSKHLYLHEYKLSTV